MEPNATQQSQQAAAAQTPSASKEGVDLSPLQALFQPVQHEQQAEKPADQTTEQKPAEEAAKAEGEQAAEGEAKDAATQETKTEEKPEPSWKKASKAAKRDARRFRETGFELERLRAETAQKEAEIARLRGIEEALRQDPMGALRALGVPMRDVIKAGVREGTTEHAIEQVRQELKTVREENQRLVQSIQQREFQTNMRAAEQRFVETAQDQAKYPHLADQPGSVLLNAARGIIQVANAQGYRPSNEEVLDLLEREYSAKSKTSKRETPSASGANGKTASPASSRTITNSLSASRPSLPANFEKLSDEAQKQVFADWIASQQKAAG